MLNTDICEILFKLKNIWWSYVKIS